MRFGLLMILACCVLAACDDDDGAADAVDTGAAPDAASGDDGAVAADAGGAPDAGESDAGGPAPADPDTLAEAADLTRLTEALEFIARIRYPGSEHWQAVQDRCAEVFESAGFTVTRHDYGTGVNVIGVLPGVSKPDEQVVVSAHYDHIEACSGADDNASGTAAVLETARLLGGQRFARTLVVACWDEEEQGLVGSREWVEDAVAAGQSFHAVYVYEGIGYKDETPGSQLLPEGFEFVFPDGYAQVQAREFRGDFLAAVGDDINPSAVTDLEAAGERFGVPIIGILLDDVLRVSDQLGDFRRSDHAPFWDNGQPGIMLTDSANFRNPYYHCSRGDDDIAHIDVDFMLRATQAVTAATATQLEPMLGEPGEAPAPPTPTPLPEAACDVVAQDCGDGQKCSLVLADAEWTPTCTDAPAEGAALGAECVRPEGVPGDDTCGGGFCAFWGHPQSDPQVRTCKRYCRSEADCDGNDPCIWLNQRRELGACAPGCDPIAQDCPEAGTACIEYGDDDTPRASFFCFFAGEVDGGEACAGSRCLPGFYCGAPSGTADALCYAYCDDDADCADGQFCNPEGRPGGPEGVGYCVPRVE